MSQSESNKMVLFFLVAEFATTLKASEGQLLDFDDLNKSIFNV
jgi:hypothetical protein